MEQKVRKRILWIAREVKRNLRRPGVRRIQDPAVRMSVAKYYKALRRLAQE